VVHPHPGATSTNSSSSLLASFNLLTCTEPQDQLRRGQEICALFARSSFPKLGYNTKPTYSLLRSLALSSASLTQYARSTYNYYLHLAQLTTLRSHRSNYFLHRLAFYLYITKSGLNMGKPMGRHSHTRYISPKPKNP
jgi:hypothetical protein